MGDSETTSGGKPPEPISPEALADHVLRVSEDLERAWSAALDDEALERARDGLSREWTALVQALHTRMEQAAHDAEAAGLDPTLTTVPLGLDVVADLDFDAAGEARWHQLQLAQLVAFEALLGGLNGLHEPTAERVDLMTQEVERWWESGAFALVRSRAALLARVTRELEHVEAELFGSPKVSPAHMARSAALELVQAANVALRRGDPEGALLHGHSALRLRAMSVLGEAAVDGESVEQPGKLFSTLPSLAAFEAQLSLLDTAVERMARGEGIDVGVSIPLAYGLLPLISDLAFDPPAGELRALMPEESPESS